MSLKKIIDLDGLSRFKSKILAQIPTKTSDLTNDSGFITGYTEADPTVPNWAKALTKPSYTASEVGAVASAQGESHVGEFLVVGSDGVVTTVTMSAWSGGSY